MRILFCILLLCVVHLQAEAKDLANRLGVGFSDQFGTSSSLPSLAMRYYPSQDLAVGASLGVDTEKDASQFGFSAKIMRIIFQEDHLNFYLGASGGLVSQEVERSGTVENDSGFDLTGFAGSEFFIPGIESVGWSFEMGVGITSISSQVRFRTIADHPFRAGMVFYF